MQQDDRGYAFAYGILAYAIAIFGTGLADFLHLQNFLGRYHRLVGRRAGSGLLGLIPQRGNALRPQHHDPAPEILLLSDVFATLALGTALGDVSATALVLSLALLGSVTAMAIMRPDIEASVRIGKGTFVADSGPSGRAGGR